MAVNKIYLEAHNDNNVAKENVLICVLIQYQFDEYGVITPIVLQANFKCLNKECHPSQPIKTLYSRIKEIQAYAKAGNRALHRSANC
jgi:hypothetical protein